MSLTYVDAVGVARDWINSRTATLVGEGKPLQKGATLKVLDGATPVTHAFLSLLPQISPTLGAESPTLAARISAQVYGPTLETVTIASVALAEELTYGLMTPALVLGGAAKIWVSDDVTGPSDFPDQDWPRHLLDFTLVMSPT